MKSATFETGLSVVPYYDYVTTHPTAIQKQQ
jgi:hypothetical protein